jgi:hypothetical protein
MNFPPALIVAFAAALTAFVLQLGVHYLKCGAVFCW